MEAEPNVPEVTSSTKFEIGTSVPFWEDFKGDWVVWCIKFSSPLVLLWIAKRLILNHSDVSLIGIPFYVVLGVLELVALGSLRTSLKKQKTRLLDCKCPACGTEARWSFEGGSFDMCGSCGACLKGDGHKVTEFRIETVQSGLGFPLQVKQYLPVATLDNHQRLQFQMPAMCAICGSLKAPNLYDIVTHYDGGGLLDEVASAAMKEAKYAHSGTYRDSVVRSNLPRDPKEVGNFELGHLKVPVCQEHSKAGTRAPLDCYSSGELRFTSYRYYKAFCMVNKVPPMGKLPTELPTASISK